MKEPLPRKVVSFGTVFDANSPLSAHILLGSIFLVLAATFILLGITPSHDSIGWFGAYHYFYSSIGRGVFPFWNPYSQTGTPFFPNLQAFGLLEPSHFIFILIQKLTGSTTLTTYLFHFLFCYSVFIIGTYNSLRVITKNNKISLLFSFILLLACFPIFMRQMGTLTFFFLIPFITFFLTKLLEEGDVNKKGFYFFVIVSLCAISFLIHIPTGTVFYVLLFFLLAFILKMVDMRKRFQFIASKYGLFWIGASIMILILISSPVATLYYESLNNNELFPSIRVQQLARANLPKMFASDLGSSIFLEGKCLTHSITLGNLVGLVLEPSPYIPKLGFQPSEVVLYISILPLFCLCFVMRHLKEVKDKYAYLFLGIAVFTLLLMCNFKRGIVDPLSLFQRIISSVVPTLDKIETLQNFGTLFLFCLVVTSAIGYIKVLHNGSKTIWVAALSVLAFRYLIFFAINFLGWLQGKLAFPVLFGISIISIIYILSVVSLGSLLGKPIISILKRIRIEQLRTISVILLLMDLVFFNIYHIKVGGVIGREFYATLKRENILETRLEDSFINYREPFLSSENCFPTFFGHEILNVRKFALPGVVKRYFGGCYTPNDHIFSTQYYYDYLVNVRIDNQLATSNVVYPILNFYPIENVIIVKDKYEAIRRINELDIETLGRYIFIEKNKRSFLTPSVFPDSSHLFDPENNLRFSPAELVNFESAKTLKYPGNGDVNFRIEYYDVNNLSVIIETFEDGYFYFGDGYSKHWKAFLDDQEVKIEKTNINFKSVYVPKGKHSLFFIYDPVYFRYSVYASLVGSVFAIALVGLYLSLGRPRRD